jgi:predicted lactoylglutathione lyase
MTRTSFDTNPVLLQTLLKACEDGKLQLPDFQRSWVWEEDRIMSLIASVSRGFPMGALMSLKSKVDSNVVFAFRPIEGAPAALTNPEQLLLDGQQRMTSLYQSCMRRQVVTTITPKKRLVKRWFYIDILKALNSEADRESAVFAVPEDRQLKENFDKDVTLDLSAAKLEYEKLMFPLNQVFSSDSWMQGFWEYWTAKGMGDKVALFFKFKNEVLANFVEYQVPVIALGADTSHEAVCLVFEKVNTGGKALDAFELLTAMYAAQGHKLRDDWLGDDKHEKADLRLGFQKRLATFGRAAGQAQGVLANVASTDFLQAIALLYTKELRLAAEAAKPDKESEWPAVRATRQSLLDLPLVAYKKYRDSIRVGFERAAKFLRRQHIHRVVDLPYQTQLVPLAAIFAEMGDKAEHDTNIKKLARWYWCGVFGELYGSAVESRFAKDILEVPRWLEGGAEPSTVEDGILRADRLLTMRSRLSAAYKGLQALLMREGACDFRTGHAFDQAVFFDEAVDIHHIFPKAWCESQSPKLLPQIYDSVINKTPLGYQTNRIIGGVAPSIYLGRLEKGKTGSDGQVMVPPIEKPVLAQYLETHCIPVDELYTDNFRGFMKARQQLLLDLVAHATGHTVSMIATTAEEGDDIPTSMAQDSGLEVIEPD